MTRRLLLITLIVLTASALPSSAGLETTTGREEGIWEGGSLIIARVRNVRALDLKQDPQEDATHILTLEPLLSLAGHFDPSAQSEIQVRLAVAEASPAVHEVPEAGWTVLALIYLGNIDGDETRRFLWVEPSICNFMPERAGLVRLTGPSDKRIVETLGKVREARGSGTSTSRPAGAPLTKPEESPQKTKG